MSFSFTYLCVYMPYVYSSSLIFWIPQCVNQFNEETSHNYTSNPLTKSCSAAQSSVGHEHLSSLIFNEPVYTIAVVCVYQPLYVTTYTVRPIILLHIWCDKHPSIPSNKPNMAQHQICTGVDRRDEYKCCTLNTDVVEINVMYEAT